MTEKARKLLSEALELPLKVRAEVAVELLASIDGEPDEDVEAAWAAEIERRAKRALAGKSAGQDWREVWSRLEAERKK